MKIFLAILTFPAAGQGFRHRSVAGLQSLRPHFASLLHLEGSVFVRYSRRCLATASKFALLPY